MSGAFHRLGHALAFAILLTLCSAPSWAETPQNVAATVAPTVESVSTGGAWAKDGCQGSYRLMVVVDPTADFTVRIFLQWVTFDKKARHLGIAATAPVKEINHLGVRSAYGFIDAVQENKAVIQIEAAGPEPDTERNFTLTATTPGQYSIEELSKDTLEEKPPKPSISP